MTSLLVSSSRGPGTVVVAIVCLLLSGHAWSQVPDRSPRPESERPGSEPGPLSSPPPSQANEPTPPEQSQPPIEDPDGGLDSPARHADEPTTSVTGLEASRPGLLEAADPSDELVYRQVSSRSLLDVHGFADFRYTYWAMEEDNRWWLMVPEKSGFAVGSFNVYLRGNLSEHWNSLAEVRLLFLPNGIDEVDPETLEVTRYETKAADYVENADRSLYWGAIEIERIWLEYAYSHLLAVRAGLFMTPYGIWNMDHASPVVIPTMRPFVIGQELFPERQVGLHAYGADYLGPVRLGYHFTVSNGRIRNTPPYRDFDGLPAFGGRLFLALDQIGDLTFGTSAYGGRFTDQDADVTFAHGFGFERKVKERFDEFAVGADLNWNFKGVTFMSEFVMRNWHYLRRIPPQGRGPSAGLLPDDCKYGGYGLIAYKFFFGLQPFLFYEGNRDSLHVRTHSHIFRAGLNFYSESNTVLKLEYTHVWWTKADPDTLQAHPMDLLVAQVVWMFGA